MIDKADRTQPASRVGSYTSRPGVVTLICILTFIGAGWQSILFWLFEGGRFQLSNIEHSVISVVVGVFIGLPLMIGIGMWRAQNWARIFFVIFMPLMRVLDLVLLPNPFSAFALVVVLILAVLLFRPEVSAYFRGIPSPAIDPASGLSAVVREIVRCASCGKEIYSTTATGHHCGAEASLGEGEYR